MSTPVASQEMLLLVGCRMPPAKALLLGCPRLSPTPGSMASMVPALGTNGHCGCRGRGPGVLRQSPRPASPPWVGMKPALEGGAETSRIPASHRAWPVVVSPVSTLPPVFHRAESVPGWGLGWGRGVVGLGVSWDTGGSWFGFGEYVRLTVLGAVLGRPFPRKHLLLCLNLRGSSSQGVCAPSCAHLVS